MNTVYYAGRSERRIACLNQLPEVDRVECVNWGEEPDIADVMKIIRGKLAFALPIILQQVGVLNGHVVVAADSRTEILVRKGNEIVHESKGKPRDDEEVFSNFVRMAEVLQLVEAASYQLRAASIAQTKTGTVVDQQLCVVRISSQGIRHLATEVGFIEYQQAYADFYSTPPYSSHNLSKICLTGISSGLSLPVLVSMGIIERVGVNGEVGELDERRLKEAMLAVAVGFGPRVLEKIHPESMDAVMQWSWLNQVTQKVINHL